MASCALHPSVETTLHCDRCGNFACNDCIQFTGLLRYCTACRERRSEKLPELARRATRAQAALLATSVVYLLQGLEEYFSGRPFADLSLSAHSLWCAPVFLVSVALFLAWFHLAVQTSREQGANVALEPWQSVGVWFVPYLNLYVPFVTMRRMLAADARKFALAQVWQFLCVPCGVAVVMTCSMALKFESPPVDVLLKRDVLVFVTGLVAVLVIRAHHQLMSPRVP